VAQARRPSRKPRRLLTAGFSLAVHAAVIAVLLAVHPPAAPMIADVEPIPVMLAPPPLHPPEPPAQSPAPPAPAPEKTPKPPPPKLNVHRTPPAPADVAPLHAVAGPTVDIDAPSDAEIASATTADSGSGAGRSCNMAGWLQAKLRKDPRVQAAMAESQSHRPLRVWNGDWVRHEGQEGAGLATVREALMWEVAFAPPACRTEPVHGLVLLSLNDGPGAARVALGSGEWRWSDLMFSRSGGGVARR
jgi:hypothetical protein